MCLHFQNEPYKGSKSKLTTKTPFGVERERKKSQHIDLRQTAKMNERKKNDGQKFRLTHIRHTHAQISAREKITHTHSDEAKKKLIQREWERKKHSRRPTTYFPNKPIEQIMFLVEHSTWRICIRNLPSFLGAASSLCGDKLSFVSRNSQKIENNRRQTKWWKNEKQRKPSTQPGEKNSTKEQTNKRREEKNNFAGEKMQFSFGVTYHTNAMESQFLTFVNTETRNVFKYSQPAGKGGGTFSMLCFVYIISCWWISPHKQIWWWKRYKETDKREKSKKQLAFAAQSRKKMVIRCFLG